MRSTSWMRTDRVASWSRFCVDLLSDLSLSILAQRHCACSLHAFVPRFALHSSPCLRAGSLHFLAHVCVRSNVQMVCPERAMPQACLALVGGRLRGTQRRRGTAAPCRQAGERCRARLKGPARCRPISESARGVGAARAIWRHRAAMSAKALWALAKPRVWHALVGWPWLECPHEQARQLGRRGALPHPTRRTQAARPGLCLEGVAAGQQSDTTRPAASPARCPDRAWDAAMWRRASPGSRCPRLPGAPPSRSGWSTSSRPVRVRLSRTCATSSAKVSAVSRTPARPMGQ